MISCKIILATQKGCIELLYLCTRDPMEVWVSGRYQHIARSATKETLAKKQERAEPQGSEGSNPSASA